MPELHNVVQETTDYSKFSFLDANRIQNRGHIEAIKNAFTEVGNLTQVQPILVNSHFQIIDGQHRFRACEELGVPIFYTVITGLGITDARKMNVLHRSWTVDDFARSYALSGDRRYQKYLQLREDYGFSHSVTLTYILNGEMNGRYAAFRNGDLVIEDEAAIRDRLNNLLDVQALTPLASDKMFAVALLKAMNTEQYNHAHMLQKIEARRGDMKRMSLLTDSLRQLEEVYNYGITERNRVRFY